MPRRIWEGRGASESGVGKRRGPHPEVGASKAPIPLSAQSLRRRELPLRLGALRGADWGAGALLVLGALRGAL